MLVLGIIVFFELSVIVQSKDEMLWLTILWNTSKSTMETENPPFSLQISILYFSCWRD